MKRLVEWDLGKEMEGREEEVGMAVVVGEVKEEVVVAGVYSVER